MGRRHVRGLLVLSRMQRVPGLRKTAGPPHLRLVEHTIRAAAEAVHPQVVARTVATAGGHLACWRRWSRLLAYRVWPTVPAGRLTVITGGAVPDWRVKALTQRTISRLPSSHRLNYVMQRWVTRSAVLRPALARRKIGQAGRHLAHWRDTGATAPPDRVVEVGTGWFPLVTVGLALAGCGEVVTADRAALLRPGNVAETLQALRAGLADGWVADSIGPVAPDRRRVLESLAGYDAVPVDALAELGVHVLVGDAAALPFPPGSCDLFVSNNTMEHIGADQLLAILREFRRLSGPRACMTHFIDMSDHYSHFDATISSLNFLRFDDRGWRRWDNGIVPQNRLRLPDYRALHARAGFRVLSEDVTYADVEELQRVPLAPRFAAQNPADVRATYVWMVSVPETSDS